MVFIYFSFYVVVFLKVQIEYKEIPRLLPSTIHKQLYKIYFLVFSTGINMLLKITVKKCYYNSHYIID